MRSGCRFVLNGKRANTIPFRAQKRGAPSVSARDAPFKNYFEDWEDYGLFRVVLVFTETPPRLTVTVVLVFVLRAFVVPVLLLRVVPVFMLPRVPVLLLVIVPVLPVIVPVEFSLPIVVEPVLVVVVVLVVPVVPVVLLLVVPVVVLVVVVLVLSPPPQAVKKRATAANTRRAKILRIEFPPIKIFQLKNNADSSHLSAPESPHVSHTRLAEKPNLQSALRV